MLLGRLLLGSWLCDHSRIVREINTSLGFRASGDFLHASSEQVLELFDVVIVRLLLHV